MPLYQIKNKETGRTFGMTAGAGFEIPGPVSALTYGIVRPDAESTPGTSGGGSQPGPAPSTFTLVVGDDGLTEIVTNDGTPIVAL